MDGSKQATSQVHRSAPSFFHCSLSPPPCSHHRNLRQEYADDSGVIRILGRASVDILKVGGYKIRCASSRFLMSRVALFSPSPLAEPFPISALDVERVLLEHPDIAECAVVGLPDPSFGTTLPAPFLS